MSTSQRLTEEFLTCTVCTDTFTDPCTLECYHTFCRQCVVNFTKTQPDAIRGKSLPCPLCRKWTKTPNPGRPVDAWADQMKPSFMIQGLLDSFGPKTEESDKIYCTFCKEEGETTPAIVWCSDCNESLCERCSRMHQRIPSSRHHDVIDLTKEESGKNADRKEPKDNVPTKTNARQKHQQKPTSVHMFSHIRDPVARMRALCDYGSKVDVDNSVPVKMYLRSGREMIRMADVYVEEGNLESAFILYNRYLTLLIEKLPKHPDFTSAPVQELEYNKQKIRHLFPMMEEMKRTLISRYAAEENKAEPVEKAAERRDVMESKKL